MEYTLRVLTREFKIQPSIVHVVNPNPNDLKIFKFYFKYETEKLKQEFPNLRAVRFYPTFGEYINRYFKPGSGRGGISLAFGGSVFQCDVMNDVEQKETVRSVWDVLSPGGIFTYFGYSSSVFKQDIMALIPKEEFFYRDDKFDIYIKSLDHDAEAVKMSSAPQILANPERGALKIGAINLPANSILQAIEKSI
ncbi:MAG: hypothetical protein KKB82_03910 [Candidatus Omnitrophica bacterium]|nr:hypothetical protein [Candidatus Omnitrophota bacterium]MBU1925050.1 hypothetical protein [Candidatus Omnitrophota bacterium]